MCIDDVFVSFVVQLVDRKAVVSRDVVVLPEQGVVTL